MSLEQMEGQELAGRFLLRRLVGKGGYGAVFEAEQLSVGRRCAVKVLLPDQCENEAMSRRFAVEARAISQLVHTNSVVLYDFGQSADHDKLLYLAMEYLEGQDLNQFIETEGQIGLDTTVHIARQIGGSLYEAHMKGLIHRDVKPHNIMLIERHNDPYFVKVIDFGIAKALQSSRLTMQELTQAGTMIGTPHYMAPEQVLDGEIDGRTDQYALATTLYKMLAGRTPFQGVTAIEVASKQLSESPLPVSTYRKDLRDRGTLDGVLLKALSKKPAERYADMMEFIDAFAAAAEMEDDESYLGEENTLVDAPTPPSQQSSVSQDLVESGGEDLPKTLRLEAVTAQGNMAIVGDDKPGSTLFIAQGFNVSQLDEVAPDVPQISEISQEQSGRLVNPQALELSIVGTNEAESKEPRSITAEITSSLLQHKRLLGFAFILSCVFIMLFSIVFGRVLFGRIKARIGNSYAIAAEPEAKKTRLKDKEEPRDDRGLSSGSGLLVEAGSGSNEDVKATKKLEKAGKELALSVHGRAQVSISDKKEQERLEKEAEEEAKAAKEKKRAQMARVRVTLIPWGTLYVNQRAYSDKPRQEVRLSPGRYTFRLKQGDEEKVRKTVDVGAGSNTMVELVAK